MFEVAESLSGMRLVGSVELKSLEMALKWAKYLEEHALKVYMDDLCAAQNSALILGKKIVEGSVRDGDTLRSIYRHHWTGLGSPEQVQKAMQRLDECAWARIEHTRNGSGQGAIVRINPNVYAFAQAQARA